MQAVFETLFDICYLVFVIAIGILILNKAKGRKEFILFGAMAVILGCGDAFHLVPRMIALCTTGMQDYAAALGIGKLITSITMTLFYVLLYYVWKTLYPQDNLKALDWMVWILAIVRIALCLFPQNEWTSAVEPLSWGIYRNIPFAVLGLLMIVLFFKTSGQDKHSPFHWMWLAITLSFAFYIPVVLFAQSFPPIGMLMIPKTCAYVWIVCMGWNALKQANRAASTFTA
ncbi:hypothetical protein IM774_11950 [Erysipelotrichaceae bacterium RD49]|nr:hypothetical protein [Erysipelotrichaceae bacterium RD49]